MTVYETLKTVGITSGILAIGLREAKFLIVNDSKIIHKEWLMKLPKWLLVPCLALAMYTNANASDIFIGRRGPTEWQLDQRIVLSENEKTESTTSTTILKYWDGDEHGKWGSVFLPYKHLESNSPAPTRDGFGDLSVNFGPRGRSGNFHWFLYGGLTLPTGEIGNERTDVRLGGYFTQMSADQKYEIDGALEYNSTGTNNKGINTSNEVSAGLLFGRELSKQTRFATGFMYSGKENGDYSLNSRSVFRYTRSKRLHFELIYEMPLHTENIPRTTTFGVFTRYNF